jgi:sodium-dependent phosphate transporter
LGAAFTVLLASRLGIPVSTTHCAVGAVVFVGIVKSGSGGVSWKVFIECILTWVVTLPASGLLAALIAYLLVHFTIGTV